MVIGKDTRLSSYTLEYALAAGITASGGDAYIMHVTTTPSVSFVTRCDGFDCGVMISASHNPYSDNGIKLVNGRGEKLERGVLGLIERYLDGARDFCSGGDLPLASGERVGRTVDYIAGRNRYTGHLIALSASSFKGMRIGLDCANGAGYKIAPSVFEALGATLFPVGCSPDGLNVNDGCGATDVAALREAVRANGLDVGFAFDGDADRVIFSDAEGHVVNGDRIIGLCALDYKAEGKLTSDSIAVTSMSNMGLIAAMKKAGIRVEITAVGDRYVIERMKEKEIKLGGEQSGHLIFLDYATTGDGIISALHVLKLMKEKNMTLAEMASFMEEYPQHLESMKVREKVPVAEIPGLSDLIARAEQEFGEDGRVVIRYSGTENKIRVLVECKSAELADRWIRTLCNHIQKELC